MNQKSPLGRLEKLNLREYWESEAQEFTPWLAQQENIALLGETIGMELDVEAQEKEVGPFRADILCKDTSSEHWVLIENQLERTDHTHLGQLIAYAAGLNAVTIIWIADRFTDEHRAALDWLNEITGEQFSFFGIEIELWRIGNSPLAPKFNIVSKPNDWTKAVRNSAENPKELTEAKQIQLAFWSAFKACMEENNCKLRCQKPQPQNWMNLRLGRNGFRLNAIASMYDLANRTFKQGVCRVELEIFGANNKDFFQILANQCDKIEAEIGEALIWYNPENAKICKIYISRSADVKDKSKWNEYHVWLKEKLELFHRVFTPIVKQLTINEIQS